MFKILPLFLLAAGIPSVAGTPSCLLLDESGISARSVILTGSSLAKTAKGWKLSGNRIQVRWVNDFGGSPIDTLDGPLELRPTTEKDLEATERRVKFGGVPTLQDFVGVESGARLPPEGCLKGDFSIVGYKALRLDKRYPLPGGLGVLGIVGAELVGGGPIRPGFGRKHALVLDRSGTIFAARKEGPWSRRLDKGIELLAEEGIDLLGEVPDLGTATTLAVRLLPREKRNVDCQTPDSSMWTWLDLERKPLGHSRGLEMVRSGEDWVSRQRVGVKWGFASMEGRLVLRNHPGSFLSSKSWILAGLVDPVLSTPWSKPRMLDGEFFLPSPGWKNVSVSLKDEEVKGRLTGGNWAFHVKDSLVLGMASGDELCEERTAGILDKHLVLERDGIQLFPWFRLSVIGRLSYQPHASGLDPNATFATSPTRSWRAVPPIFDTLSWRAIAGIGKFRPTGEIRLTDVDSVEIRVLVVVDSTWKQVFQHDTLLMMYRAAWHGRIDLGQAPRLLDNSLFVPHFIGRGKVSIRGIDTIEMISRGGRSVFVVRGREMFLQDQGAGGAKKRSACLLTPSMECLPVQ